MSKLWALTKVLIKNNVFSSGSKNGKSKKGGIIALAILLVFVGVSLCVPIVYALDSILEIAKIENIIISIILPMAGVTTIVFSIFSVVSVFYLSKDSEHLLPLPIEPKNIIMSKFLVSLLTEYYILFMFILPCLIGVGVGINASVLYYLYMIIIFILLPIIPSAIVTIIILFITRFTGVIKNKDVFMYVSMVLILVFAFGYNYIIQNVISIDPNNVGGTISEFENAVLPYFKAVFPFYNSASSTLINYNNLNGAFSLIAFIGFNFLALLLVYFIGDKLYLNTLTNTRGSKKKTYNVEEIVCKSDKKKSVSGWLLKKEWLIVKRSPVFMLNIVIVVFLVPVIFVLSFLISFMSSGVDTSGLLNSGDVNMYLDIPFVYLIIFAVLIFFTCTSVAASTSISREGSNAWFMKVIPVSYFKQINIKVLFAVLIDMLGVIATALIPIIIYKIPVLYVISLFIPLIILVVLMNYLNILIDLKRPRLNWSEESEAVKQNLNSMISMFSTIGVCVIFGVFAFLFFKYNITINIALLAGIISLVCGIILAFVIYYFYKNSSKLVESIE